MAKRLKHNNTHTHTHTHRHTDTHTSDAHFISLFFFKKRNNTKNEEKDKFIEIVYQTIPMLNQCQSLLEPLKMALA